MTLEYHTADARASPCLEPPSHRPSADFAVTLRKRPLASRT